MEDLSNLYAEAPDLSRPAQRRHELGAFRIAELTRTLR